MESVLDAVLQIAKAEGPSAVNTNRIAEVAGVSVGSVYQYFPDKQAIYAALHRQHLDELDRLIGRNLIETERDDLAAFISGLVPAVFELHTRDAGLYRLLAADSASAPHSPAKFTERLEAAIRIATSARPAGSSADRRLGVKPFVVATLLESLAAATPPAEISPESIRAEAVQAILRYLELSADSAKPSE